jgi:hypothetical protein
VDYKQVEGDINSMISDTCKNVEDMEYKSKRKRPRKHPVAVP